MTGAVGGVYAPVLMASLVVLGVNAAVGAVVVVPVTVVGGVLTVFSAAFYREITA